MRHFTKTFTRANGYRRKTVPTSLHVHLRQPISGICTVGPKSAEIQAHPLRHSPLLRLRRRTRRAQTMKAVRGLAPFVHSKTIRSWINVNSVRCPELWGSVQVTSSNSIIIPTSSHNNKLVSYKSRHLSIFLHMVYIITSCCVTLLLEMACICCLAITITVPL